MFLLYFGTFMGLWAIFNTVYVWRTPYDEAADIKAGNTPPATALVGAEIGFLLPLCAASYVTKTWIAFVGWGLISAIIQLGVYELLFWKYPSGAKDNEAAARVFAGAAFCAGLAQTFSMIP
jgi:uncharacterized membrane protein YjfL (UPF0719 family)